MRTTRIQRYTPTGRNHQRAQWGCGCVLAGAFTVLLAFTLLYMFWPTLTGAALQVAGLDRIGDTGSVFANVTVVTTPNVELQSEKTLTPSATKTTFGTWVSREKLKFRDRRVIRCF